jgi:hypothetical protein
MPVCFRRVRVIGACFGERLLSEIRQIDLAPVGHPAAAIYYLCTAAADDLVEKELALNDPDFRRRVGLV